MLEGNLEDRKMQGLPKLFTDYGKNEKPFLSQFF